MTKDIIPIQHVAQAIRFVREERVLFDFDLARLYGVTTGNLNKAGRRNRDRFPADFMFQLSAEDTKSLIFQFGISISRGEAIRQLMSPPEKPRREIGFHVREKAPRYRTRNHL